MRRPLSVFAVQAINHTSTTSNRQPQTSISLDNYNTRSFYLDLIHSSPPTISALLHWQTSLRPTPTFNSTFWKNIYAPLSHNKHCNITRKTAHRILPTALSLYRMTVHPTPNCGQCGSVETLEHLLLDCPNIRPFWNVIASYIDKISSNQVPMTPHIQL